MPIGIKMEEPPAGSCRNYEKQNIGNSGGQRGLDFESGMKLVKRFFYDHYSYNKAVVSKQVTKISKQHNDKCQ